MHWSLWWQIEDKLKINNFIIYYYSFIVYVHQWCVYPPPMSMTYWFGQWWAWWPLLPRVKYSIMLSEVQVSNLLQVQAFMDIYVFKYVATLVGSGWIVDSSQLDRKLWQSYELGGSTYCSPYLLISWGDNARNSLISNLWISRWAHFVFNLC